MSVQSVIVTVRMPFELAEWLRDEMGRRRSRKEPAWVYQRVLVALIDAHGEREAEQERQSDHAMALARRVARERDERFEQLKTAEAEADRYRVALRRIIDTGEGQSISLVPGVLVAIAKDALR